MHCSRMLIGMKYYLYCLYCLHCVYQAIYTFMHLYTLIYITHWNYIFVYLYICRYIDSDSVLHHITEIYIVRNISLWKHKHVLKWVHSVLSGFLLNIDIPRVHGVFTTSTSGITHVKGLKQQV